MKKEFIEKIKKQHGYLTEVDALELTHIYLNQFGHFTSALPVEEQLCYMWFRLNGGKKIKLSDLEKGKVCKVCCEYKEATSYYKRDGVREKVCKVCNQKKNILFEK